MPDTCRGGSTGGGPAPPPSAAAARPRIAMLLQQLACHTIGRRPRNSAAAALVDIRRQPGAERTGNLFRLKQERTLKIGRDPNQITSSASMRVRSPLNRTLRSTERLLSDNDSTTTPSHDVFCRAPV